MRTMALAAMALLLAGCEGAFAASDVRPGHFRLEGMREMASMLELTGDGRFRYALVYGALDEAGEGRWKQDGDRVLLTTEPAYTPPRFDLTRANLNPSVRMRVRVLAPDGTPMQWPIEVIVETNDGAVEGRTGADGYEPELPTGTNVRAMRLGLAIYDFLSEPIALDLARGNDLVFTLRPNSLGQPPFNDQPLLIEGDDLVMLRGGSRMTYRRED